MLEESTKPLSSTTGSKKKRNRYVYLEKFKALESRVADQEHTVIKLSKIVKRLYQVVIVGGLIVLALLLV